MLLSQNYNSNISYTFNSWKKDISIYTLKYMMSNLYAGLRFNRHQICLSVGETHMYASLPASTALSKLKGGDAHSQWWDHSTKEKFPIVQSGFVISWYLRVTCFLMFALPKYLISKLVAFCVILFHLCWLPNFTISYI